MSTYRTNALPRVPRWGATRWVRFWLKAKAYDRITITLLCLLAIVLAHFFLGTWETLLTCVLTTWIGAMFADFRPAKPLPPGLRFMEHP